MKQKEPTSKGRKKFAANTALLVFGIASSMSGLIIQCRYHLLKSPDESLILALTRGEWHAVHVWTAILFSAAVLYHAGNHRKWYQNVLKRTPLPKQRPTLILTLLMFVVAISGLIPWLIASFSENATIRGSIIEFHDKVAILFFIVALGHATKRSKGYFNAIRNKL